MITENRCQPVEDRDMEIQAAISDLIRSHRKHCQHPLSQEELAYRSGISYEHLNHIENYRSAVSIEVLDRISRALGFQSLSDFLARDQKGIL